VTSKDLDRQVKLALDETRLLILGVQVLLGFQFQSFFQDGFAELSSVSQWLCVAGVALLIASVGLLIAPSMQHRLVEDGRSSVRLVRATNFFAGCGLVPLTASLGLGSYVVAERHFGLAAGLAIGLALAATAAFAWFGLEIIVGLGRDDRSMEVANTPLATRVEQLLTEARLIIPGAQALLGFQFIAMLTSGFDRLPQSVKAVHALALCLVALNVILLMTPAALHRLSFNGKDSRAFLRMGSALVIAAPCFLAAGIAAETFVVVQKVSGNAGWAPIGALVSFVALIGLWYAIPVGLRIRLKR
jgi:thiosulfate reductase cytochrome b subunit